jgi:hypothetical protein
MGYSEYQKLLTKAKNKMSPYLNSLGLYYNKEIQKFIGFNDYEIILIEFEEFLTDTEIAIGFKRYTNCLDDEYSFVLPNKKNLYGCRDINFSHWRYYPEGIDKKDKKYLNQQLEMITDEMLEQIKLKLEPRILTEYPVDIYIKEKYLEITDEMARKINLNGYTFSDEWYEINEERINSMPWWSNLCNEEYAYVSKKREEILPYKAFFDEMNKRYKINKEKHQKNSKEYLLQFEHTKSIEPQYRYHLIQDLMNSNKGYHVEAELRKHGFVRQESIGCHRNNQEAFYSEEINLEIYLTIYDGIRWAFSYSIPDEYSILVNKDIDADCDGLCLIDDDNFRKKINQTIENLVISLKDKDNQ